MLSNNILFKSDSIDTTNKPTISTKINQPSHYSNIKNIKNNSNLASNFNLKTLNTPINVCYIGAGYVGGTSSAVMAYKCPKDTVTVTVCDINENKIKAWNSDKLPIYEPGLEDIVNKQRGKNLFFTTDLDTAIDNADIIFISVGTPTKQKGFGAGEATELKYVESAARKIAEVSKNSKIIVEKSTVPCRTAEHLRAILNTNKVSSKSIIHNTLDHFIKHNEHNNNNILDSPISYNLHDTISNEKNELNSSNNQINSINTINTSFTNEVNINYDNNNLMDSLSFSNNDLTLTDIDSSSETNTCFQNQEQEQELNKQMLEDDEKLFNSNRKNLIHFEILSNPEFLSEGTAINDLLYPDRILIGGLQTKDGIKAQNILYQLYSYWIPKEKIITMGLWSTELSKLAANALLAQRISSINSLSTLCEEIGADIQEISYACGLDSRIGSKFLNASVGFGGSCFKKDILNLVYLSNTYNLPEVAEYWKQVITMNEFRKMKFIKNIFNKLFNTITGKSISVFGFAFKKDTEDTRESAAITIVMSLLQEGALVKLYDPKVSENQIINDIIKNSKPNELNENISNIIICNSAYDAAYNSDAIVICTEWDEFTSLDYKNIYNNMNKPAFIFDGRLILNHQELKSIGFVVEAIGKKI